MVFKVSGDLKMNFLSNPALKFLRDTNYLLKREFVYNKNSFLIGLVCICSYYIHTAKLDHSLAGPTKTTDVVELYCL